MASNRIDPFTGTWRLSHADSRLASLPPLRWIQKIEAVNESVCTSEEISFDNGTTLNVSVEANFDGADYPVHGSAIADTIAYTRLNRLSISGVARKDGKITLIETVSVSPDHSTLTMEYSIRSGDGQETSSVAVFKREPE